MRPSIRLRLGYLCLAQIRAIGSREVTRPRNDREKIIRKMVIGCYRSTSHRGRHSSGLSRRARRGASGKRGVDRYGHAERAGRQDGRTADRNCRSDPRRDAGDRGLKPALRGERRAIHDSHAHVSVRHCHTKDHRSDLHPRRPSSCNRCAMTIRDHLRSSNTSSDDHVLLGSPAKTY